MPRQAETCFRGGEVDMMNKTNRSLLMGCSAGSVAGGLSAWLTDAMGLAMGDAVRLAIVVGVVIGVAVFAAFNFLLIGQSEK